MSTSKIHQLRKCRIAGSTVFRDDGRLLVSYTPLAINHGYILDCCAVQRRQRHKLEQEINLRSSVGKESHAKTKGLGLFHSGQLKLEAHSMKLPVKVLGMCGSLRSQSTNLFLAEY